jgi:hypothetical protein
LRCEDLRRLVPSVRQIVAISGERLADHRVLPASSELPLRLIIEESARDEAREIPDHHWRCRCTLGALLPSLLPDWFFEPAKIAELVSAEGIEPSTY